MKKLLRALIVLGGLATILWGTENIHPNQGIAQFIRSCSAPLSSIRMPVSAITYIGKLTTAQKKLILNNLTVSNTDSGSFTSINSALDFINDYLDSGLYNNEPIRIKVLSGTYDESVDLSPLAALGVTNFTLEGEENTIIDVETYGINLHIPETTTIIGATYNLKNLKITGCERGIVFKEYWDEITGIAQAPKLQLHIDNCTVNDCETTDYDDQSDYICSAAAIHFEGAGSVANCQLQNNTITTYSNDYSEYCQAGGLFICNNTTSNVEVSGNRFTSNTGALCGGLVAKGLGAILIHDNEFRGNICSEHCNIYNAYQGNAISVYNASNITINNNLLVDNIPGSISYGTVVGLRTYLSQAGNPIKFLNNTIVNTPQEDTNGLCAIKFRINAGTSIQDIQIRNNIISATTDLGCTVDSDAGFVPVNFSHNLIYNTNLSFSASLYNPDDPLSVYNPTATRFNYTCNPQLGSNLAPLWTQTTMSPCIDAGIGDNDPDGTPPDIGAKRAENHALWQYSFTNQADLEKWYWVSYPVLNRTTDLLKASEFFEELLKLHENSLGDPEPIYLDEIDWMEEGESDPRNIIWSTQLDDWSSNQSSHFVSSPQGYKIKLLPRSNPSFPAVVTLKESGFKTSPYLPFNIYGGVENWLGYFKEEPSWPHEVFASIWEDINMIKTKSWCIVRANPLGDYWGMHGKVSTLKYGDMVVVTTNNDHTFQWNNTNIIEDVAVATPVHFTFNEKQDYFPVYISLPDSLKIDLKEIGLYLDGVCKGAVVVENNLEQICAYLDIDEKLTDGVVEFVFYYNPDKSQVQECRTLRIDNSRFAAQYVNGNRRYPFYTVTLSPKDLENVTPLEFALNQNYPNPFNPTTTISYQLPESGKVRLDVYNPKGQLVKTLIDGTQVSGLHSIVWNGTDTKNRSVASGVYLYRLSSQHNVQTKRMLLMK